MTDMTDIDGKISPIITTRCLCGVATAATIGQRHLPDTDDAPD